MACLLIKWNGGLKKSGKNFINCRLFYIFVLFFYSRVINQNYWQPMVLDRPQDIPMNNVKLLMTFMLWLNTHLKNKNTLYHVPSGYPSIKCQCGSCIKERKISPNRLQTWGFFFIDLSISCQDLLAAFGIRQHNKFSKEQRSVLQQFYESVKYPTLEQRIELSQKLCTTENQVYWWFTKTRQRDKKNKAGK